MNRMIVGLMAGVLFVQFCSAQEPPPAAPQKIYLIKITERDKKNAYKLVSTDDYKLEQENMKLETSLFAKAMSAAEQEWKKDDELKKKAFPRSAINQRELTKLGEFMDQAKADDKLKFYEDLEFEKEDKAREREKEKKKDAKKDAKKDSKKDDKEFYESRARDMFEMKLQELKDNLQKAKEPKADAKAEPAK